jgi:cytochrome c peroxidase
MKTKLIILTLLSVLVFACSKEKFSDSANSAFLNLGNFDYAFGPEVPHFVFQSQQHQLQVTDDKARLGRVLFYDKNLSVNSSTSCGSCHLQEMGFADGLSLSKGFAGHETEKHSMTIINEMGQGSFFWNSRAFNLKDQVLMPVANHIEMGIENEEFLLAKLKGLEYYQDLYVKAFGDTEINIERTGEALASFVGSIASYNTKFDQVNRGEAQFTAQEEEGLKLFHEKYQCASCHAGNNFNETWGGFGGSMANIGLESQDLDPSLPGGMAKIPTLRNIAVTAPYMHDGRFATLSDVLNHYSHGIKENENLDWRLRNTANEDLDLNISTSEKAALLAFLNTLTDDVVLTHPKYADPFN